MLEEPSSRFESLAGVCATLKKTGHAKAFKLEIVIVHQSGAFYGSFWSTERGEVGRDSAGAIITNTNRAIQNFGFPNSGNNSLLPFNNHQPLNYVEEM